MVSHRVVIQSEDFNVADVLAKLRAGDLRVVRFVLLLVLFETHNCCLVKMLTELFQWR